jgi:hypothetical protein
MQDECIDPANRQQAVAAQIGEVGAIYFLDFAHGSGNLSPPPDKLTLYTVIEPALTALQRGMICGSYMRWFDDRATTLKQEWLSDYETCDQFKTLAQQYVTTIQVIMLNFGIEWVVMSIRSMSAIHRQTELMHAAMRNEQFRPILDVMTSLIASETDEAGEPQ